MSPTAIIYARVSSARQAEDGLPIASQLEQCRRKAQALGVAVVREFLDEGISGRSADRRPEFLKALAFCDAQKVGHFIVWNSARFARNKMESAKFKLQLRRAGTKVAYASADIDPDTDEGWLSESMIEVIDELYSRGVSKDTKRSMRKNAEDGFFNGGRVPYGYRVAPAPDGRRKRLVIDEIEAPLVRRIFAAYVGTGIGCKQIAMELNELGFSKRGERWNKKGVGLVLKNHRYIGVSIFNRRNHQERTWRDESEWIIAESHEAIIDKETFGRAQLTLAARAPAQDSSSPRSRWVFTGLAHCGLCGSRMKISTGTGRSKIYAYYTCPKALDGSGRCRGLRIRADELDRWLTDAALEQLLTPARVLEILEDLRNTQGDWARDRKEARELLVRELRDVEGKRDRLFAVLEEVGAEAAARAGIMERLQMHRDRIDQIDATLANLEEIPDAEFEIPDMEILDAMIAVANAIRQEADIEKRRLFFAEIIQRVDLGEDGAMINYYPERMLTMDAGEAVHSEGRWLPEQALLRTARLEVPFPPRLRRVA